ncbi:MAG: toxin-antitoxin system HicB family antitoxin [Chitinophagaceae bacterium]|nr:toxin-antitoxin system HicB family antitoxin [Oligoflexus sp.]
MAEKAKAKKAKALSKKTSVKSKKREELEPEAEELQLEVEEVPKRAPKGKVLPSATLISADKEKSKPLAASANPSKSGPEEKEIKVQTTPEIIAPIQPRVVVNKPETSPSHSSSQPSAAQTQQSVTPRSEPARHENRQEHRQESKKPDADSDGLRLRLSQSLTKKLKEQAADEGISLEEFVGELLAESVVLRAWEIVERKNAMKGHPQQGPNSHQRPNNNPNSSTSQGGQNRGGQRGNNQGNKGHRGMSHVRYQTIMDDKATFLEYVRSQEKTRR